VADPIDRAARAARRGSADEALVLLWNELEPARLSGDRGALGAIDGLARYIARDEQHRHEAERLIEAVAATVAAGGAERAATAVVDAEVERGGEIGEAAEAAEADEPETQKGRGFGVGNLVWVLILLGVLILNILGRVDGD
jgi:hypothetical protein